MEVSQDRIYGRIEHAWILPERKGIRVKLDTGAKSSSIDARNLEFYLKNGKRWVRFEVWDRNRQVAHLEREVVGTVRIRKRPSDGGMEAGGYPSAFTDRPVVQLTWCINRQRFDLEVNLADRSGFLYPAILGRDDMRRLKILIDPSLRLTQPPACLGDQP